MVRCLRAELCHFWLDVTEVAGCGSDCWCFCIHIKTKMASGKGKLAYACNMTNQYVYGFLGIKWVISAHILSLNIVVSESLSSFLINMIFNMLMLIQNYIQNLKSAALILLFSLFEKSSSVKVTLQEMHEMNICYVHFPLGISYCL